MANRKNAEALLLDALYCAEGPQHILDTASAILNRPLILVDHTNIVLAQTRGAVPITNYLAKENKLSDENRISETMSLIPVGSNNKLILSSVLVRDSLVARVGIFENGVSFSPDVYEFAGLLCKILSVELRKGTDRLYNALSADKLFMQDILEQRLNSDEVISNRLRDLTWTPKGEFYLFAFPLRGKGFSAFMLDNIQDSICRLIPNSLYAINESGMSVLTTVEPGHTLSPDILSSLASYLRKIDLRAGISARYSKLYETHYALEQAFTAIEMSEKMRQLQPLSSYDDMMIYHVLDYCSWKIRLKTLCMPGVLQLQQYDETHTTKLTGTLRCYLDHAQDINRTADALHIHRNTLTYRLDKLKKILGTDFDTGNDIMRLNLSFTILDYLKKIG